MSRSNKLTPVVAAQLKVIKNLSGKIEELQDKVKNLKEDLFQTGKDLAVEKLSYNASQLDLGEKVREANELAAKLEKLEGDYKELDQRRKREYDQHYARLEGLKDALEIFAGARTPF